jgi:hypothetical protein
MNFTCTKTNVECYKFRSENSYWADITVDANGGKGRIQIASDYGAWQYYWGAAGENFKVFLTKLGIDYVADKFGCDKHFDDVATKESWKESVKEAFGSGDIGEKHYKNLLQEIEEIDCLSATDFQIALNDGEYLLKFFEYMPDFSYRIVPHFQRFWDDVWPCFIAELKKELAENPQS